MPVCRAGGGDPARHWGRECYAPAGSARQLRRRVPGQRGGHHHPFNRQVQQQSIHRLPRRAPTCKRRLGKGKVRAVCVVLSQTIHENIQQAAQNEAPARSVKPFIHPFLCCRHCMPMGAGQRSNLARQRLHLVGAGPGHGEAPVPVQVERRRPGGSSSTWRRSDGMRFRTRWWSRSCSSRSWSLGTPAWRRQKDHDDDGRGTRQAARVVACLEEATRGELRSGAVCAIGCHAFSFALPLSARGVHSYRSFYLTFGLSNLGQQILDVNQAVP